MRQFAAIFLFALGFVSHAEAQSFLQQLREKKTGEGTVTVNQSKTIDELVNNAKLVIQPQTAGTPTTKQQSPAAKQQVTKQETTKQHSATQSQQPNKSDSATKKSEHHATTAKKDLAETTSTEHHNTAKQPDTDTEVYELSSVKKVPRVSRKVTGYRVQAYAGGNSRTDRQKAEDIKNAIKTRYPELPVYVHFYSPRWICRVGNFRTFEEANTVLKNIKAMGYKQACIVKGKINVGY